MNAIRKTIFTALLALFPLLAMCQAPPVLRQVFTTNTASGVFSATGILTNYWQGQIFANNFIGSTFLFSLDGATNQAGLGAVGDNAGMAIGYGANGSGLGVAIGTGSVGYNNGVAIGNGSDGSSSGVSIGTGSLGYNNGVAIGNGSDGSSSGVSIGNTTAGDNGGVAIGSGSYSASGGVGIGFNSFGLDHGVSIGKNSIANGVGNVAIGGNDGSGPNANANPSGTFNDTSEIGRGSVTLNGALHYRGVPIVTGAGVHIGNGSGLTNLMATNIVGLVTSGVNITNLTNATIWGSAARGNSLQVTATGTTNWGPLNVSGAIKVVGITTLNSIEFPGNSKIQWVGGGMYISGYGTDYNFFGNPFFIHNMSDLGMAISGTVLATALFVTNGVAMITRNSAAGPSGITNGTSALWNSNSVMYLSTSLTNSTVRNDGVNISNGVFTVGTIRILGLTNTAPINAVTPVLWEEKIVNGVSYRVPLYQ